MKEVISVTTQHVAQWIQTVHEIEKITQSASEPTLKQALGAAYNFALTELIRARALLQELEKKL